MIVILDHPSMRPKIQDGERRGTNTGECGRVYRCVIVDVRG